MLPFTYVFRYALAWLVQKEGVTIYICVSPCTGMVDSEGGCYYLHMFFGMHWHGWFRRRVLPFIYVFRYALVWLVQKEGVTIYICVSVCTGMVGSEGGCYYLHVCFGMHWHGWFRRRVLPFTYVFRHALACLIQKEGVTIYICFSACTGMVGSEGGCYHLHICFGMHWHGWFRRRVLPFTYVFRHALAWLVQKEGVTIYICVSVCTGMVGSVGGCYHLHLCFGMHWHGWFRRRMLHLHVCFGMHWYGWFRRRVLPFTCVFRHALVWLVQKEGVTIYMCVSACTGMVDSEGGCYHLHMCFGMHWYGWFRRRVLLFTCVSVCTGMVGSEGGCYHLHMCFGMHWHGWFRRRVLPFTYVFRYALAWLVQKEGVTIYICVSACTGMVGSEGGCYHLHMCFGMHWYGWFRRRVLPFTCVSVCTGMVGSEGGCYHLHMCFGMHWHGWFRRRVLLFTYVFRYALAWLVLKEGVTIYICVSVCTGMVGSEGECYHLHMCFGMHWYGWFRRRVLPFTYVFRYALAWLVKKEGVTIYICVSVCTGMIGSEGGCYHLHMSFGMHWHGWFRRRVLPFTYVFRYALAWLVQKEGVTIYICVSACTGMVDSEGGCYHLHMCFGMHWHGWFRRRVLLFTYVFRHALAWLVQKEGVTISMCFGMHWHGWFRRRVLPFTYVFRYALAWLVQKEGVTIYICFSACTGMVGSEGGCYHFHVFRHALAWLVQKEGVTISICVSALAWLVQKEGVTISMRVSALAWFIRYIYY